MKKTYSKPEVQEVICAKSLCDVITVSVGTEQKAGSSAWGREEEDMMWDEEQGW